MAPQTRGKKQDQDDPGSLSDPATRTGNTKVSATRAAPKPKQGGHADGSKEMPMTAKPKSKQGTGVDKGGKKMAVKGARAKYASLQEDLNTTYSRRHGSRGASKN